MIKKSILPYSKYKEIYDIFSNDKVAKGNITKTAKEWCKRNSIPYSDTIRRKASKVLRRGSNGVLAKVGVSSTHNANILLFDLETSYIKAYTFGLFNQNISHDNIIEDWKILCFSAKWLFSDEVIGFKLTEEELKNRDDSRLTKELWKLLDKADIAVAHNLNNFDNKKAKAKFFEFNLGLPSPYKSLDTLQHARTLGLTSKRLDYISKFKGHGGKNETSRGMWRDVMEGDYNKLIEMALYCDKDVLELENVYLDLLPYIKSHPNLGLFVNGDISVCPSCGSDDISWNIGSDYITNVNRFSTFRCNSCQSIGRSRTPIKLDKKNLTSTTAN